MEAERLDEIVHPVPIANGLHDRVRPFRKLPCLDLAAIGRLTFEQADKAFVSVKAALQAGGAMPTILNTAKTIVVEADMAGQKGFCAISKLVEEVCSTVDRSGDALATDAEALATDGKAQILARRLVFAKDM